MMMNRNPQCLCSSGDCLSLAEVPDGQKAMISCNKNLKTIERGFYLGMQISMFRNDANEPNLIVAVGDARYVLDRRIAQDIKVKIL
jgi:Fe2+ transport system protein FeoA